MRLRRHVYLYCARQNQQLSPSIKPNGLRMCKKMCVSTQALLCVRCEKLRQRHAYEFPYIYSRIEKRTINNYMYEIYVFMARQVHLQYTRIHTHFTYEYSRERSSQCIPLFVFSLRSFSDRDARAAFPYARRTSRQRPRQKYAVVACIVFAFSYIHLSHLFARCVHMFL